MTVITIRECFDASTGPTATVRFNHGAAYPVTIQAPLSDEEEQHLAWYFEQYLYDPPGSPVAVEEIEGRIYDYGEALFEQLFTDHLCYARYEEALQAGIETLTIEIVGSAAFQQLYWEALKDPNLPHPLITYAPLVRMPLETRSGPVALRPSDTINILVVTARPAATVRSIPVVRSLVTGLQQARLPVQVDMLRPGTYQALVERFASVQAEDGAGYYHVVHVDLESVLLSYAELEESFQIAERSPDRAPVEPYPDQQPFFLLAGAPPEQPTGLPELAALLREYQVPLIILSGCQAHPGASHSSTLAHDLVQAGVPLVLAADARLSGSAGDLLLATFYHELAAGCVPSVALRQARAALYGRRERLAAFHQLVDMADWLLPVLYQKDALSPATLWPVEAFSGKEAPASDAQESLHYQAAPPRYGFVGRDLDMLRIENRLMYQVATAQRNLLLVRGIGGVGKTALLHELAAWWQQTGLVGRVFYFGYDQQAWTLREIVDVLITALVDPEEVGNFPYLGHEARLSLLVQQLRRERHLLILDTMESVTGTALAVPHTLSLVEQSGLRSFLADLLGGQTLVLLGSRTGEEWLMQAAGTVLKPPLRRDTVYELSGLDSLSASFLADQVLLHYDIRHYREDTQTRQLLQLLHGHPLAIEVVLAYLVRQSPAEVYAALRAAADDTDVAAERRIEQPVTTDLLTAIDMAHSRRDATAQTLLSCLAPFTGIIWQDLLQPYANLLRQQPALADVSFEQWQSMVRELTEQGLLRPDSDLPAFLRIQPGLSYILRRRLQAPARAQLYAAVQLVFYQLYNQWSGYIAGLIVSEEENEQQLGVTLAHIEYDNLVTALNLALEMRASMLLPYMAISRYLESIQDEQRQLDLDAMILTYLDGYPQERLNGPDGYEFVSILNNIARRQLRFKQFELVETAYRMALSLHIGLTIFEEQRTVAPSSEVYVQKSREGLTAAAPDQLRPFDPVALASYVGHQERYSQASAYLRLGNLAQARQQWLQAEQQYQQALSLYGEYQDRYSQGIVYQQLGAVAQERQEWDRAEQFYRQALAIKREYHDRYGQSGIYHQLGRVSEEQRKWGQAEEYYRAAMAIKIAYDDRFSLASTYHQLGRVAQVQGEWSQAEAYYQQSLALKQEFQDRRGMAAAYHQLGMVAQARQEWEQAEQHYQQALAIYREHNDQRAQALTCGQLGLLALDQHQEQRARDYLLEALNMFQQARDQYYATVVMRSLARLWRTSGDTELSSAVAAVTGQSLSEVEALMLAEET